MNKMIIKNDYIFIFLLALAVSVISFGLTQLLFHSADIIVYKDIFNFFSGKETMFSYDERNIDIWGNYTNTNKQI